MSQEQILEVARQLVANAPVQMTLCSLDGLLLEMSPSLAKATAAAGHTREQMIGRFARDLVATGENSAHAPFDRLAAGEEVVEIERFIAFPDGRTEMVRLHGSYWRDAAGTPVGVLFVHTNVTAEMRAAAGRRKSEAQLKAVIDNIPSHIALVDLESGVVELMNAKLRGSLGAAQAEVQPGGELEVVRPEHLAVLKAEGAKAEASGGLSETERELHDSQNPGRVARVKHIVCQDDHGHRHLLWIADDITEIRQTAEDLRRVADEAQAANRAKSEFLANMSHEIRTPLNGVMGVAGALARTPLSEAQREMVSIIETSAKTLTTLLSDILDLARIEAGKMEIKPEPFDLSGSVTACAALFDAAAQAKGLDLTTSIEPNALGAYVGDAGRIRQILSNLLGNAVKFTKKGAVSLTVTAQRDETSSVLRFQVRDSGIGFDAEAKARLFSRFEQADGSITRKFGGSGLGLSISRSLADAMGGRLEADSTPGEGSVFTLTLELPRTTTNLDIWLDEADPDPQVDPLVGMRVLLAEDHPVNRRVVELILGSAGVDLTCVENGLEAVQAFSGRAFDLVLMDMQMPVMDGLTAIREIRALEAASGAAPTPIHVLTANAMPEHISASHEAGADGHLAKPIVADVLIERVAEAAAAGRSAPGYKEVA